MCINKRAIRNNNNNGNNRQNIVSMATGRESITVVIQWCVYRLLAIDTIHRGTTKSKHNPLVLVPSQYPHDKL
jgi:hypothetical protein